MTTTFKEWQLANLTPEQQVECNNACVAEAERATAAGGNPDQENWGFTDATKFKEFDDSISATFKRYFAQYEASTK